MKSCSIQGARAAAAVLLAGLLLTACPFPVPPGYESGSRENLAQSPPEFIVAGETTREDVLMVLGEPDGRALDESWLSYGSAYGRGGAGFVVMTLGGGGGVAVEGVEHRRLVVYFDKRGVVERTQFDKRVCTKVTGDRGESRPCIDPAGSDLPLVRSLH